MIYSLFADLLLIIHFCYILFVIFGGLLMLRWRNVWKLHLPAVIWGFIVQYFVLLCPLTTWENYFRDLAGESIYTQGFIDYYLTTILYPDITPKIHVFFAIILLMVNVVVYYYVFLQGTED